MCIRDRSRTPHYELPVSSHFPENMISISFWPTRLVSRIMELKFEHATTNYLWETIFWNSIFISLWPTNTALRKIQLRFELFKSRFPWEAIFQKTQFPLDHGRPIGFPENGAQIRASPMKLDEGSVFLYFRIVMYCCISMYLCTSIFLKYIEIRKYGFPAW